MHEGALTLVFVMASSGVVKVVLSFHRDYDGGGIQTAQRSCTVRH